MKIGEFLQIHMTTSVITIPDTPLNRRADYVVQVSGDSMEPIVCFGKVEWGEK